MLVSQQGMFTERNHQGNQDTIEQIRAKDGYGAGKLVRKIFDADWPELIQRVQKRYSYDKMIFIRAFLDLSDMYNS